jgi:parvulin-like peptidyl-prolyl isomerase
VSLLLGTFACDNTEKNPGSSIAAQEAPPKPTIVARHIIIEYHGARVASPALERTREEARDLAAELRDRVVAGEKFEELVTQYSSGPEREKGGSLGSIPLDKLSRSFSEPVPELEVGEVAPVLESPFGFHVLQRTE